MKTVAFAMGPDFKANHEVYHEIEVVDFYQIFCFLLRIPAGFHNGSWDRVADFLTISGSSTPILSLSCLAVMLFLSVLNK